MSTSARMAPEAELGATAHWISFLWARRMSWRELKLTGQSLELRRGSDKRDIALSSILGVSVHSRWPFATLVIRHRHGNATIEVFRRDCALDIAAEIESATVCYWSFVSSKLASLTGRIERRRVALLAAHQNARARAGIVLRRLVATADILRHRALVLEEAASDLRRKLAAWRSADRWSTKGELDELVVEVQQMLKTLAPLKKARRLQIHDTKVDRGLERFAGAHESMRRRRNDHFVRRERQRLPGIFSPDPQRELTLAQARAVVIKEQNVIVVAPAGSGKTAVIEARIDYLMRKGTPARDILVLTYSNATQGELEQRIKRRLGKRAAGIAIRTFHGLGRRIMIASAGRRSIAVNTLATDEPKYVAFIRSVLDSGRSDPEFAEAMLAFMLTPETEDRPESSFSSLEEYYRHLRKSDLRALSGDRVRSREELKIANFLYLNGVEFEYERKYEGSRNPNTSMADVNAELNYRPDFYLPAIDVYLEHFGIDRRGRTRPGIDARAYAKQIEWKRKLHAQKGTKLLTTFSWMEREGGLEHHLESMLSSLVELRPRPADEVFAAFDKLKKIDRFAELVGAFLNGFRASDMDMKILASRISKADRDQKFFRVFRRVEEAYRAKLEQEQTIDFHDMIKDGTRYASDGTFRPRWRHILVDEYQDISADRQRLLRALSRPNQAMTFVVGDDWQAIFRFAGSDVTLFTNFGRTFSPSEEVSLDQTFRFNTCVSNAASTFVTRNPKQKRKIVKARAPSSGPSILVCRDGADGSTALEIALRDIEERSSAKASRSHVYLLGRYRHDAPTEEEMRSFRLKFPRLSLEHLTVHKSKGLESDFVIVLGLRAGTWGFPCEIGDDPLLRYVMPPDEDWPYAEERRLFYVALTRTRDADYLLADTIEPSPFVSEIEGIKGASRRLGSEPVPPYRCPHCNCGSIQLRAGTFGPFLTCTYEPFCDYKRDACAQCGYIVVPGKGGSSRCVRCKQPEAPCEVCRCGTVIVREFPSTFSWIPAWARLKWPASTKFVRRQCYRCRDTRWEPSAEPETGLA